jgi:hypothetical protein
MTRSHTMSAAERRCDDQSKRFGPVGKTPCSIDAPTVCPALSIAKSNGPTRVGELGGMPAARLLKKTPCATPDYYRTRNHCFAFVDRPRNPS